MNKLIVFVIFVVMVLTACGTPASSAGADTCTLITAASLQDKPGSTGSAIAPLSDGQTVTLTGMRASSLYPGEGTWAEVNSGGVTGWVNRSVCK